ncbi:hypothetical protein H8959_011640 [Pygathrix nigripes]
MLAPARVVEDGLAAGPGLLAGAAGGRPWWFGLSRTRPGRRVGGGGSERRQRLRGSVWLTGESAGGRSFVQQIFEYFHEPERSGPEAFMNQHGGPLPLLVTPSCGFGLEYLELSWLPFPWEWGWEWNWRQKTTAFSVMQGVAGCPDRRQGMSCYQVESASL